MAEEFATVKDSFDKGIAEGLKQDPEKAKSVNAVYLFNITGDGGGKWTVDLTADPPAVIEGDAGNAQCTITIADQDWLGLLAGKLNGQQLFMSGKLKISGDMSLAMKLQKVTG
ncbi:MAG: SCP2 sterol-binding domain-containing protein [Deltaproteobacteria bacterium]|nr:MAG: SCP2 sterol-binding domain-containing protein [Deltaproteobacteria bacterium]